jgi:hypothetical protein
MPNLDQSCIASLPATWTADNVRQRLVDAFTTERKLPGQRFTKAIASSWPATPLHTFTDMLHWNNPQDGVRDREWKRWENAKAAFPIEISMMEEAYAWLLWLPKDERQCLEDWCKCEAFDVLVSKVMRKHGFKKTTFYRKRDDASNRIADRLNTQGVVVRTFT